IKYIEKEDERFWKGEGQMAMNHRRISQFPMRIYIVYISLVLFALYPIGESSFAERVLVGVTYTSIILAAYFGACTPLPPAKSKSRNWVEGVVATFRSLLRPTPVPTTE
ncbi:MAG: hypothetical protein AAB938_00765, partial [Patescibacteria group bacterium]